MAHHWWNIPRSALIGSLILALTFLVACGTAAPEVVEREVIKEVQVEVPKEVEVVRQVEVPVEVEREVLKEVEVVKEVEVLKEIPKETVVEKTVIATPTPIPVAMETVQAKVDRVIYALGEVQETNRHWTVSRPSYYQFDPYGETLVGLDANTNERIPRLAKSWEWSEDGREWTFNLVEGVPFHFGYGEFTAHDAVAAHHRTIGEDSQSSAASFFGDATAEAIDDYTVKYTFPGLSLDTPAILSRGFGGGEVLMLSKNQFDTEGLEGFDAKPAGTGSYQYLGREAGQGIWFEKAPGPHWRGENPDFQEVELRWVREDLTRLAALLTGEIHVAALSRELQLEAGRRGMLPAAAGVPTNYLSLFLGGMYFSDGDPAYDANVPWANPTTGILIRQAMNKAINREEMLNHVLKGDGELMYNTAYHPVLGNGYNPQWEDDWEELYGYDVEAATSLMAQAGYSQDNPMPFTSYNYFSADEPETAVMLEALINYWEPVGIDVTLLDSEWGTVRKEYRAKGDFIKKGGWGNVITMRSLTTRLRVWSFAATGNGGGYETDLQDQNYLKYIGLETVDREAIDLLIREIGDDRFYNFADIPFFWFRLTVMFNPEVVESWTFPGTASSKTSHWDLLKATQ
ncbi:MAG: ABC transporter substrate-binding protein [Chloroflexota bacterium]|nr:ABC transporter substrate-binding protein [Chloroflexota bacterium]